MRFMFYYTSNNVCRLYFKPILPRLNEACTLFSHTEVLF